MADSGLDSLVDAVQKRVADGQQLALLLGSALTMPDAPELPGVPPTGEMTRRLRVAMDPGHATAPVGPAPGKALHPAEEYQAAVAALRKAKGQAAVNKVIRAAVLEARSAVARVRDATRQILAIEEIEADLGGWELPRAVTAVARMIASAPHRFRAPIFTPNFDPLIEIALKRERVGCRPVILDAGSGRLPRPAERKDDVLVVHYHGYWIESTTLHTDEQIGQRGKGLAASLRSELEGKHLLVVGFGGWQDALVDAIEQSLEASSTSKVPFEVLWAFFETDEQVVRAKYEALLEKLRPGTAGGFVQLYYGIDRRELFERLAVPRPGPADSASPGDTRLAASAAAAKSFAPLASMPTGWQRVDREFLQSRSREALSVEERVRFFNGQVPNWRLALDASIPRRSIASQVVGALRGTGGVPKGNAIHLLCGAGGEGKSTCLLQIAAMMSETPGFEVLWRPPTATTAWRTEDLSALPADGRHWLLVSDEADAAAADIYSTFFAFHEAGRSDIRALIASRDTDWRASKAEELGWHGIAEFRTWIFRGIDRDEASRIVAAWGEAGAQGLGALAARSPEERVDVLVDAAQGLDAARHDDGTLLGALLKVRFGREGLRDHVRLLLQRLRERKISESATLADAFLATAAADVLTPDGLDLRVLGNMTKVEDSRVRNKIVRPLGEEAAADASSGSIRTRHRSIAVAAIRVADEEDRIVPLFRQLVRWTHKCDGFDSPVAGAHRIVHRILDCARSLRTLLPIDTADEVGLAMCEGACDADREDLSLLTQAAHVARELGRVQKAITTCRKTYESDVPDIYKNRRFVRAFYVEWSACEAAADRLADAVWLDGIALSDHLNPIELTSLNARFGLGGLGVGLGRLRDAGISEVLMAAGVRAVATLMRKLPNLDAVAKGHARLFEDQADAAQVQKMSIPEATAALSAAVVAAGDAAADAKIRAVARPTAVTFTRLGHEVERNFPAESHRDQPR